MRRLFDRGRGGLFNDVASILQPGGSLLQRTRQCRDRVAGRRSLSTRATRMGFAGAGPSKARVPTRGPVRRLPPWLRSPCLRSPTRRAIGPCTAINCAVMGAIARARIVGRHPAGCRTKPSHAAAQGRMTDRSAKIASLAERTDAGGDRHRCAAARPAAGALAIPRIDRFTEQLIVSEPAPGEFRGVRSADHDRAGAAQICDRRTVIFRYQAGKCSNAVGGRATRLVGIDLGRDWNAVQRPCDGALRQFVIRAIGQRQRRRQQASRRLR